MPGNYLIIQGGAYTKIPDVYAVLVCSSVDTKGEKNFSIMILKYNFLTLKKTFYSKILFICHIFSKFFTDVKLNIIRSGSYYLPCS